MIYAVEAVRRDEQGCITQVRWHAIDVVENELVHGPSEVVNAQTAMHQATQTAVHVCYKGAAGSQLGVSNTPKGVALVNYPHAPDAQLLENLATF